MTKCAYSIPDGPPSRRGPPSTAADFRKLTPIVLMQALEQATTVVCEPIVRVSLEIPTATVGTVLPAVGRLGACRRVVVAAGWPLDRRDGLARDAGCRSSSASCRG